MVRTWMIRGTVAVVFAVLVGAWAVGVSGIRDSPSPKDERPPASRDESIAPEFDSSVVRDREKSPRNKQDQDPDGAEPILDAGNVPPSDAPVAPAPETIDPTPDAPGGSQGPSDPPPPPPPSDPSDPSDPPSEPTEECTDLISTVGCVLDPVVPDP